MLSVLDIYNVPNCLYSLLISLPTSDKCMWTQASAESKSNYE